MKFRRFGNTVIGRVEKGRELMESIKRFCELTGVKCGCISGIGAAEKVELGIYEASSKDYVKTTVEGDYEITSLNGNVTVMDGEVYLHVHVNLTDKDFKSTGGHLYSAVISATCELVINVIDGTVERFGDGKTGLNLMDV